MGVLEVREVASQIDNVSVTGVGDGCLNQCAACRVDHSDRDANCLYLAKADAGGS